MAQNYVHFLAGNPLNRLGWLRSSAKFLRIAASSPTTQWIVFNKGEPLISRPVGAHARPSLAHLLTQDVKPLLGAEPYFGQGEKEGQSADEGVAVLESSRLRGPIVVFLGIYEPEGTSSLPVGDFKIPDSPDGLAGVPYFSLDVTGVSPEDLSSTIKNTEERIGGVKLEFVEPRAASSSFSSDDGAIFSEGRSLLDWNFRNKFCPACGSRTYSLWGGWKLSCSSLLPWADNTGREPCPSGKGLQNFAHPRTDAVVITAVIDETGEKILLGRNKRFPFAMYSTLAGFLESGETLEEAVQREIFEESGLRVTNIRYHSSQPWPYPANLMIGCFAIADSSQTIRTDLDNELADARWFTREEVLAVLAHPNGTIIRRQEYKKLDEEEKGHAPVPSGGAAVVVEKKDEPPFRIPPLSAIAGVLISSWAHGKAKL